MSMAHSRRTGKIVECALLAVLALMAWSSAGARKSDRTQQIKTAADVVKASTGSHRQIVLIGHARISQGTLLIRGAKAIGYENNENEWDHAVVTGSPARFQQQLDNGSMVHGSADTIEYLVSENTVILTGHATVVQQGRGEFHGAKLTYNTDTGEIVGKGGTGGQVHMTFQPKSRPPAPAGAHSTGAPASAASVVPASAASVVPASAASVVPASAASVVPASATPAAASTAGTY